MQPVKYLPIATLTTLALSYSNMSYAKDHGTSHTSTYEATYETSYATEETAEHNWR